MNVVKLALRTLLGKRLPTTEGVLSVAGLDGAVTIGRDGFGIPHISAVTDHDAWFGIGFVQGQDRAFQLELQRRAIRGTLSELLGTDTLAVDRLSRRIGFAAAAGRILEGMREEDRAAAEAFAAGVNAAARTSRAPHELTLLRGARTQATAADVVGVTLLQAFALAANWDSELARLEILLADGRAALEALDTGYPEWLPVTAPPGEAAGPAVAALREDLDRFGEVIALGGGSNNWALSPDKTATGRPILANDPHLAPVLPPHWYLAHVTTPEWGLAGACLAGIPSFGVGHNGHVAWGVTAGLIDNTDLFLEDLGPDGTSCREDDGFVACDVRDEMIDVKGGPPVTERIVVTPRGPVISPVLDRITVALSLKATWLHPERPGLLAGMTRVRSIAELHEEMRWWHGPSLNIVYADTGGDIGWTLIGEAPVRAAGNGTLPMPGWDPAVGWEADYVPYDDLPHVVRPPAGYIASANNRPTTSGEPFLSSDWLDGYRIARINELLSDSNEWTVTKSLQTQRDTVSPAWFELKDHLLATGERGSSVVSYRLLRDWDGDVRADSAAATVFETWLAEMEHRVARAAAPTATEAALGRGHAPPALAAFSLFGFRRGGHLVRLLRERPAGWFDDWDEEITAALTAAERALRARFGHSPSRWAWGDVRPLTLSHPAGQQPPLDRVFDIGPMPWGGDYTTVSQAGAPPLDVFANPSAIASLRAVMDVGGWDNSRFSLPGGQSGNPLSPHYGDQVSAWQRGEGIPMPWSKEATARMVRRRLFLVPPE